MPLVRHQDREGDGMIGDGARMHLVRQTSGGWMEEPNFLARTRQEVKLVGQLGGVRGVTHAACRCSWPGCVRRVLHTPSNC